MEQNVKVRLQKALAAAGVCSRRAAEALIADGRVRVNGVVVTELGTKVDPGRDHIEVDGRAVSPRERLVYVLLNKPAGYLTTARDPQGRRTVLELVSQPDGARLFPVGRLDADTEGLLLLTNDGELANLLLHPRYHVAKRYTAVVRGEVREEALERLRTGLTLDDGPTAPAEARILRRDPGKTVVEIVLREGRKRQVKRMLAAVGHPVLRLRRDAFGPLVLGDLEVGGSRLLTAEEVDALRRASGKS